MDTKRLRPLHRARPRGDRRAHSAAPAARAGRMSSSTLDGSTTTPASPTPSCTRTSAPRPWSASSGGRWPSSAPTGSSAERLQTDNAWTYTKNNALAALLARRGDPPHARSRPLHAEDATARWSAYQQTLKREWAPGAALPLNCGAPGRGAATLARPLQRDPTPPARSATARRSARVRDVLRHDS